MTKAEAEEGRWGRKRCIKPSWLGGQTENWAWEKVSEPGLNMPTRVEDRWHNNAKMKNVDNRVQQQMGGRMQMGQKGRMGRRVKACSWNVIPHYMTLGIINARRRNLSSSGNLCFSCWTSPILELSSEQRGYPTNKVTLELRKLPCTLKLSWKHSEDDSTAPKQQ